MSSALECLKEREKILVEKGQEADVDVKLRGEEILARLAFEEDEIDQDDDEGSDSSTQKPLEIQEFQKSPIMLYAKELLYGTELIQAECCAGQS